MSILKEQMTKDLKIFMQKKAKTEMSAIRMAMAAIKNKEIEIRKELDENQILNVIKRQIKEHKDSLSYFNGAEHKKDEIVKYNTYIDVLSAYLPEEMPEEEAKEIIEKLLAENNISNKSQMGPAMKLVKPVLEGKIDNSKISKIVKEILN